MNKEDSFNFISFLSNLSNINKENLNELVNQNVNKYDQSINNEIEEIKKTKETLSLLKKKRKAASELPEILKLKYQQNCIAVAQIFVEHKLVFITEEMLEYFYQLDKQLQFIFQKADYEKVTILRRQMGEQVRVGRSLQETE